MNVKDDVVPELYKAIQVHFYTLIDNDRMIQNALKGDESITFADVANLSEVIGNYAYKSLKSVLTNERLPDGILYWNIAERTIKPLMKEAYDLILKMCVIIQERDDSKNKFI